VLVSRGAPTGALSGFLDKNPLHLAIENGFLEIVEILVGAGADLDATGRCYVLGVICYVLCVMCFVVCSM
jgi:hypothetical protein